MRAYQYINLTSSYSFNNAFLLFGASETGNHFNRHGIISHARRRRLEMLECKNGSGNEYCNLLSAHYRFKRGAQCHLGLSKANVTEQKSVHGHRAHHIALYILYRRKLRIRLFKSKISRKGVLKLGISRKCKAGLSLPFRINCNKLLCDIARGTLGVVFRFYPIAAAHFRELNTARLVAASYIFTNHVELIAGNEKLIRPCIFNGYIVLRHAVNCDGLNTLKHTYSVVEMHNVVTL